MTDRVLMTGFHRCRSPLCLMLTLCFVYQPTTYVDFQLTHVPCQVTGRFAPWTFRPFTGRFAPSLDVSPLHWTFRHQDVSPPGRFAPWTFRPQDVSPLYVSPPGHFASDCGRFAPVCFSMCLLFLEHRNVTDGWTDRISINISHQCGDTQ